LAESQENIEDLRILEQKKLMEIESVDDEVQESDNSEVDKKRGRSMVIGVLNDDVDDM
jgi:hypothetical protein